MPNERVLITGATGFLGGALARRLKQDGFAVTATGRDPRAGAKLEQDGIRFVAADLTDAEAVRRLCAEQAYVFHSAALAAPWGSRDAFERANVLATRHVAEASRAANVRRFVFVSSPSIYMENSDRLSISEDDPLPPRALSLYAETKREAEQIVDGEHARGLSTITIRPQAIFGPGDRTIFPRLIRLAKKGTLPIIGDGKNLIDVTYIDNVVDALVLCMRAEGPALGGKFNITNGEPQSLYALVERVLDQLHLQYRRKRISLSTASKIAAGLELIHRVALPNKEPLLTRYAVCALARTRTLNIDRARTELGYTPRVSVDEGIERFVRWYRDEGAHASN
jgi:nucleoside-diphosphate-sugar epimerase